MVAKMSFPKEVLKPLNYNEQKQKRGDARCLMALNYFSTADELNFYQKLHGLRQRNDLNDRATTRTLHVSLNFHPTEQLTDATCCSIAQSYLDQLGFAGQPALVYRHFDAGHPHLHIVTSLIRADGSRIATHNLGREAGEKARKQIEQARVQPPQKDTPSPTPGQPGPGIPQPQQPPPQQPS